LLFPDSSRHIHSSLASHYAQVDGYNPDWQQLDLSDAPLPPEVLHSPESSRVTIAVYADDNLRSLSDPGGHSAQTTVSGKAAASDEHAPCGGRCCGAGTSGGIERNSDRLQDQEAGGGASAPQRERDSGEGTSAVEGTQPHSSSDGLHSIRRQDSLSAGAKPCCPHAESYVPTGRTCIGWCCGLLFCIANLKLVLSSLPSAPAVQP